MNYREKLDPSMVNALLGTECKEGLSYYLLTDRDKFVVSAVDAGGKIVDEVVLDATPTEEEFIEEDDFIPDEKHTKHDIPLGTMIAGAMLAFCIISVILSMLLLKEVI